MLTEIVSDISHFNSTILFSLKLRIITSERLFRYFLGCYVFSKKAKYDVN